MVKKVSIACSTVIIVAIGGFGFYEFLAKNVLHASAVFFFFLGIGFLFHSFTWGEMEGKNEGDKDELEKHITLVSSKISYYVLFVLMIIVLVISERVTSLNEINNIPLVVVIGLAFVTMPNTEFAVSRKYR